MVTIAEIVFALVFIILMATIFSTVTNFGDSANTALEGIRESIDRAELQAYNNATVSGDTVIATINKLRETKNGLKVSYYVAELTNVTDECIFGYGAVTSDNNSNELVNSDNKSTGYYSSTAKSTYKSYNTILKPGEDGFINPVSEYKSILLFNSNGVFIGMAFEQVT